MAELNEQHEELQPDDNSSDETESRASGGMFNLIRLKEHGKSSRSRALRLKPNDTIVAIDGNEFNGDLQEFVDRLATEDSDEWLLTIYRDKGFFEIVVRGPIGGTLEFTTSEETETIREAFKSHEVYNRSSYKIYEVLRDIHRRCDIIDTSQSSLAVLLPPIWLLQNRMWEPLVAILSVYVITFNVSLTLFILATILIGVYFRKGQVTLRRSYGLFQDRQVWAILAATDEKKAQEICRAFDPKCKFDHSLVGPSMDEKTKKAAPKRKSGLVSSY